MPNLNEVLEAAAPYVIGAGGGWLIGKALEEVTGIPYLSWILGAGGAAAPAAYKYGPDLYDKLVGSLTAESGETSGPGAVPPAATPLASTPLAPTLGPTGEEGSSGLWYFLPGAVTGAGLTGAGVYGGKKLIESGAIEGIKGKIRGIYEKGKGSKPESSSGDMILRIQDGKLVVGGSEETARDRLPSTANLAGKIKRLLKRLVAAAPKKVNIKK